MRWSLFVFGGLCAAGFMASSVTAQTIPSHTITKGALTGQFQRIDFYAALHPDCSPMPRPTVRIVTPPVHGWFYIQDAIDYPTFRSNNQRYQCNTRQTPGTAVIYRSMDGYLGPDTGTVEALSPSGQLMQARYDILVR